MINLIPNKDKKLMYRDFYFRLISLCFLMFGVSLIIASIIILPAYFYSYSEENLINTKIKEQETENISSLDQNPLLIVKDLQNKLDLIENAIKNKFIFSEKVVNEIILKKMSGIKITEIYYQNDLKTDKKINISGIALNRDVLLSFRLALEDDPSFSKIDLPISNFVKGSNIKFSLSLIPAKID